MHNSTASTNRSVLLSTCFSQPLAQKQVLCKPEQLDCASRTQGTSHVTYHAGAPVGIVLRGTAVGFDPGHDPYRRCICMGQVSSVTCEQGLDCLGADKVDDHPRYCRAQEFPLSVTLKGYFFFGGGGVRLAPPPPSPYMSIPERVYNQTRTWCAALQAPVDSASLGSSPEGRSERPNAPGQNAHPQRQHTHCRFSDVARTAKDTLWTYLSTHMGFAKQPHIVDPGQKAGCSTTM